MASFLSGMLGPGLTAASQAVAGEQEGNIKGYLMKRDQDAKDQDRWLKEFIAKNSARNIDSEIFTREHQMEVIPTDQGYARVSKSGTPGPVTDIGGQAYKKPLNLTRAPFMVDGKPTEGFTDPSGQFFDSNHQLVTGKVTPYVAPEKPDRAVVVTIGPDGNPTYTLRADAVDKQAPSRVGQGGGASGAQTPVEDMRARYAEIESAAKDLAAGKWKMNSNNQFREGLTYGIARENAGGEKVPLSQQGTAWLMDKTGFGKDDKNFPKYQALMNSTRALGDDVAKVFKGRQNEESVLREVALAELTPDDYMNAQVVEQKLSRLRHVIHLAELNNPAQVKALDATPEPSKVPSHTGASDPGGDINLGQAQPPKTTGHKRTAAEILAAHGIK